MWTLARARALFRPTALNRTLRLPVLRSWTHAENPPPRSARVLPMPRHEPFFRCWILTLPLPQTSPETVREARGCTILTVGSRLASQPRCFAAACRGLTAAPTSSTSARHAAPPTIRREAEFTPSRSAKAPSSLTVDLAVRPDPLEPGAAWSRYLTRCSAPRPLESAP